MKGHLDVVGSHLNFLSIILGNIPILGNNSYSNRKKGKVPSKVPSCLLEIRGII